MNENLSSTYLLVSFENLCEKDDQIILELAMNYGVIPISKNIEDGYTYYFQSSTTDKALFNFQRALKRKKYIFKASLN